MGMILRGADLVDGTGSSRRRADIVQPLGVAEAGDFRPDKLAVGRDLAQLVCTFA